MSINVILDRSKESRKSFACYERNGTGRRGRKSTVFKLLELQRRCDADVQVAGGFDELSGIETVQVIQYAAYEFNWRTRFLARISSRHFWSDWRRPKAISGKTAMGA